MLDLAVLEEYGLFEDLPTKKRLNGVFSKANRNITNINEPTNGYSLH